MTSTEENIIQRYGALLTLSQVAELLHRIPEGLRVTLILDNDVSRKLLPARVKIGRRVLFKTAAVAHLFAE